MNIRPKIGADCLKAAVAASGDRLNREEIDAAYQRMFDEKRRLQAAGAIDGLGDRLKSFAEREAERTRIAAAMQRRHAALNILARDRLDRTIASFIASGLTPKKALLAVLEGTQHGVEGGRNSLAALTHAYEQKFIGGLLAEIQANKPHLISVLRDQGFDADVLREMSELKEGGKPGVTGNKDAQYVAKVFASYAEMSRTELNRLGASIGKLDGWSGAQTHDDIKMIGAGKETWIGSIVTKLDLARTFPDLSTRADIEEALGGVYDTIITGFPNATTPREKGVRVNPANLAKSLGKSRVLHFLDADAALAYRSEFGHGNTVSGMIGHLRNASRVAANMETFGPNPEVMFGAIVDTMKRRIKDDPKLTPAQKQKQMDSLKVDAGQLRQAMDIATGMANRPVNASAAKIASDIRAVQSMAKLGGAVISSMSDTITVGAASMFRGSGFWKGFVSQLDGLRKGRPKEEFAEISYLLGEGFDGIIGHIVSPAAAQDGPVGRLSKMQETFFRWNGLSWWTDIQRATASRMIAAEMGMRAKTGFDKLPANYRHVLGLHGIDAKTWAAIQKIPAREIDGKAYVTPDRVRDLSDEDVAGFGRTADDGRRNIEMALRRFFADETSYGVIEPDARSRRTTTLGLRPGTIAGEAIRFVMQFKGFPIAFTQRTFGRAWSGHAQGLSGWEKAGKRGAHIGTLLAGMTMAGMASMTMKDMVKGYWPPRDPFDLKTLAAAFVQGGAAGIYGDFLFSQTNRFGGGVLETAAGPAIGTGADLLELLLKSRDAVVGKIAGEEAKAPYADALNLALSNNPLFYANLFYTRPALDYLFLDSLRDAVSPGYMKRQEKRRLNEYGQEKAFESLRPFN